MKLNEWLDFKVRNRYLDLPNESYKPAPFSRVLMVINKMYFMFSFFSLCWWVFLYSSLYFPTMVTSVLSFLLFVVVLSLFWMVLTKTLPLESFLIILIFMIGSSFTWLVRFTE